MKIIIKKLAIAITIMLTLSQTACKKFLDVNYNPLQLTDQSATPDLVLPSLMESCISASNQTKFVQMWMGYWAYYHVNPGLYFSSYLRIQADENTFNLKPRPEIFYMEQKAKNSGQQFYEGIAKVIRVLQWHRAVDVINNMPYFEAYNSNIRQPKYDDAKLIYEDLMVQLNLASGLIKNADINKNIKLQLSDIMFHGDRTLWLKFINTLKLRLLIHQANRTDRNAYIQEEIKKILAEGSGFLGSGQDASFNPGYTLGKNLSSYFGNFSNHNQYGGGEYSVVTQLGSYDYAHANLFAMELLKQNEDPRLGFIYSTADNPLPAGATEPFAQSEPLEYRANTFGSYVNEALYPYQDNTYVSAVGGSRNSDEVNPSAAGIIKGRNMNDWVLTSIESQFLQAEAIYRGWLPGNDEEAYLQAVRESFRWLNVGGNSANPALSDVIFETWYHAQAQAGNPRVSWAAAPDKYKLIMLQKYHAFNGIEPMETWVDYRRNGRFPAIPASLSPQRTGNTIPFRLLYDETEYQLNPQNLAAQGSINVFTSKIWWMP
ncbi:MAG: SusD/RagB family nutrient-binding outer membrane lipoprotein [Bacteroidota bacterium]